MFAFILTLKYLVLFLGTLKLDQLTQQKIFLYFKETKKVELAPQTATNNKQIPSSTLLSQRIPRLLRAKIMNKCVTSKTARVMHCWMQYFVYLSVEHKSSQAIDHTEKDNEVDTRRITKD